MLNQDWKKIVVSHCETFHLLDEKPFYLERYFHVMKYHDPGLAPVKTDKDAFHIDIWGRPAYAHRFLETFGFYEGVAAVRNQEGWFHITTTGESLYKDRYLWCGNFQEGYCTVRNGDGYFHINKNGENIYKKRYAYCGDFKDGVSAVCHENGLNTHIDGKGHYLHNCWFKDLDVYHKGLARAQDEEGWFHINKRGEAIYKERYAEIDAFYNGFAKIKTFEGESIIINVSGKKIITLAAKPKSCRPLSKEHLV